MDHRLRPLLLGNTTVVGFDVQPHPLPGIPVPHRTVGFLSDRYVFISSPIKAVELIGDQPQELSDSWLRIGPLHGCTPLSESINNLLLALHLLGKP